MFIQLWYTDCIFSPARAVKLLIPGVFVLVLGIQKAYHQNASDFYLRDQELQTSINILSASFPQSGWYWLQCLLLNVKDFVSLFTLLWRVRCVTKLLNIELRKFLERLVMLTHWELLMELSRTLSQHNFLSWNSNVLLLKIVVLQISGMF